MPRSYARLGAEERRRIIVADGPSGFVPSASQQAHLSDHAEGAACGVRPPCGTSPGSAPPPTRRDPPDGRARRPGGRPSQRRPGPPGAFGGPPPPRPRDIDPIAAWITAVARPGDRLVAVNWLGPAGRRLSGRAAAADGLRRAPCWPGHRRVRDRHRIDVLRGPGRSRGRLSVARGGGSGLPRRPVRPACDRACPWSWIVSPTGP